MGANEFWTEAFGATPQDAFDKAVEQARYEHGHGGYTGTIAEKHGFVMIHLPAGKAAGDYAHQMLRDSDRRIADKWGPAGCIELDPLESRAGLPLLRRFLFFGMASS